MDRDTGLLRYAAILFYIGGVLAAVIFTSVAVFTAVTGRQPGGQNPEDWGYLQGQGYSIYLLSVATFAVLGFADIAAARVMQTKPTVGARMGLVLLPPGFLLAIGMVLPIWLILDPIALVLILADGRALRRTEPIGM